MLPWLWQTTVTGQSGCLSRMALINSFKRCAACAK